MGACDRVEFALEGSGLGSGDFPFWEPLIACLGERCGWIYFAPGSTAEERDRAEDWVEGHRPDLLEEGRILDDSKVLDGRGIDALICFHPGGRELGEFMPEAFQGLKVFSLMYGQGREVSENLRSCRRYGVDLVLSEELPDEIAEHLDPELSRYFESKFHFIPPVRETREEMRAPARKISIEKTALIYWSREDQSVIAYRDEAWGGGEGGCRMPLADLLPVIRKLKEVDPVDLEEIIGMDASGIDNLVGTYSKLVIAVRHPQAVLALMQSGAIHQAKAVYFGEEYYSPYRFAAFGMMAPQLTRLWRKPVSSLRDGLSELAALARFDGDAIDDAIPVSRRILDQSVMSCEGDVVCDNLLEKIGVLKSGGAGSVNPPSGNGTGGDPITFLCREIFRSRETNSVWLPKSSVWGGAVRQKAKPCYFQIRRNWSLLKRYATWAGFGENGYSVNGDVLPITERIVCDFIRSYLFSYPGEEWLSLFSECYRLFPDWLPWCERAGDRFYREDKNHINAYSLIGAGIVHLLFYEECEKGDEELHRFADSCFEKDLELGRFSWEIQVKRLPLIFRREGSKAALEFGRKAYEACPNLTNSLSSLALYLERSEPGEAERFYEWDHSQGYQTEGIVHCYLRFLVRRGSIDRAVQIVDACYESEVDLKGGFGSIVTEYLRDSWADLYSPAQGSFKAKLESALNLTRRDLTANRMTLNTLPLLVLFHLGLNDYQTATQIRSENPDLPPVNSLLIAFYLWVMGYEEDAREELRVGVLDDMPKAEHILLYGVMHLLIGNRAEGLRAYDKLHDSHLGIFDPIHLFDGWSQWFLHALALSNEGRAKEAAAYLRLAGEFDPHFEKIRGIGLMRIASPPLPAGGRQVPVFPVPA